MTNEKTSDRQRTVEIAADAKATVQVLLNGEDEDSQTLDTFESSRNVTILLPLLKEKLGDLSQEHPMESLSVRAALKGRDAETGEEAEMVLYQGTAKEILEVLTQRNISPEEVVLATRNFFGDVFDMSDIKALLFTMVFDKGPASHVMLNKSLDVQPEHMVKLMMATVMQLDAYKHKLDAMGIPLPGADNGKGIVLPGQPGFRAPGNL